MKRFIIALVLLGLAQSASAAFSKAGTAGAQFLKIGVGSRYQGMGEASVAVSSDVYAMYWNPAGLVEIDNSAVSFTNVNWLLDIDLNYFGYARNFEDVGVFGVSAMILSMDEQEVRTFEEQDGTGETYGASSYAVGLSFARHLTAKFAFGASVKYVGEKIDFVKSHGVAVDFGTLLYTGFNSLRMGMSITNMGPEMTFTGSNLEVSYNSGDNSSGNNVLAELKATGYDLPLAFRVGMAYDFEFSPQSVLTVSAEMKHPNDHEQQGAIGAEFGYDQRYFLRGGYKLNYDEESLALGGGLFLPMGNQTSLVVDYAWQDFGRLESAQRFSVGFTF
ncbi:PorV/PorQ family protein [bacterium]|nr:PorV/PorQ family protein [bacterium]